jgi:hypothetical protein
MPRGGWGIVIAACGVALFIALGTGAYFGSLYAPNHKQYEAVTGKQTGQKDYQGPSESLPDISGLPAPVERAIANPHPNTGQDHDKRDLAAQEASALWAFWMVVVSFLSVFITAVGTYFLYNQIILTREAVEDTGEATKAMLEANKISNKQLDAAYRPSAHITCSGPMVREGDEPLIKGNGKNGLLSVEARVVVENLGDRAFVLEAFQVALAIGTNDRPSGLVWVKEIVKPGECRQIGGGSKHVDGLQTSSMGMIRIKEGESTIWNTSLCVVGRIFYRNAIDQIYMKEFAFRALGPRVTQHDITGGDARNFERIVKSIDEKPLPNSVEQWGF